VSQMAAANSLWGAPSTIGLFQDQRGRAVR
jgi:hypothetical protein